MKVGYVSRASMVALVLLSFASMARADDAAQARYHDELARGYYASGRYDLALREFFLEQQLAPNPRILFNLAVCFDSLDREDEAFTFFADYLADPTDDDASRRSHATAAVTRLSARVARVNVTTDPPGAAIYVDRRELGAYGVSPRTVALAPGQHRVWVELPGYRMAESTVTIRAGGQAPFDVHLERIVAPLHVEAPEGTSVQVLDDTGAVVASGAAPLDAQLPPATYEVRLESPTHRPWSGSVRVSEDGGANVRPPLESLPEPTGELTVTTNTLGAVVELDGRLAGFAPVVLTDLSVGNHSLLVRREGRLDWSGSVDVQNDRRTWTTVTLETPGRVSRSPASYILGATGAASLVSSIVMFGLARARYDRYERALVQGTSAFYGPAELYDEARRLDIAGSVMMAAGGVQFAIGTTLYFTTRHVDVRPSRASSQVSE